MQSSAATGQALRPPGVQPAGCPKAPGRWVPTARGGACPTCPFLPLSDKPGECPKVRPHRCVEECEADWQCPRGQSCTHTGCGHICMDSHVGEIRGCFPARMCPVPRGCGMCLDICSLDKECPWGYKCCSNGCGHVCSHRPVPAREGSPDRQALPAPASMGRKDKTQTCSSKDLSLY
uniref:WAP domain-containing protein n=1 Tax=Falco tinnunculus TaxID=100819 RepID=A0A8C4TTN4_FALTI